MTDPILFYSSKDNGYGWLSNFWQAKQEDDNFVYPDNEHYYQSQKANDDVFREWIAYAPTAYLAMQAGRSLRKADMVDSWDSKKDEIMLVGLRMKFTQNEDLKKKLLATGDAELHEDSPTDKYWGMKGQDVLGKLLMKVREELKE